MRYIRRRRDAEDKARKPAEAIDGRTTVQGRVMTAIKRTIEVDDATAIAIEARAAEAGLSVPELLAEMVALHIAPVEAPLAEELAELDRQWAAIIAGESTIRHEDVVRWLDTWGTPGFRPWHGR